MAAELGAKGVVEGLIEGLESLREAQSLEEEGTVTAISYAYLRFQVENGCIVLETGNAAFEGGGSEVRRGVTADGWQVEWRRNDLGIVSGEDFLPLHLRSWLERETRLLEPKFGFEIG